MQTFLPYPDFRKSARVLDRQRLGKQRSEAKQIVKILLNETDSPGWRNHPAVLMWQGFPSTLAAYGRAVCAEWRHRGYRDSLLEWFRARSRAIPDLDNIPPEFLPRWFGNADFHRSHRSNLLAKNPEHYSQFFRDVEPGLPYIWPSALILPFNHPTRDLRTVK